MKHQLLQLVRQLVFFTFDLDRKGYFERENMIAEVGDRLPDGTFRLDPDPSSKHTYTRNTNIFSSSSIMLFFQISAWSLKHIFLFIYFALTSRSDCSQGKDQILVSQLV
jgi:hypothetical protein